MKHALFALSLATSTLTAGQMQGVNNPSSSSCCESDCCSSCAAPPPGPCVDCECYSPQYYNLQCAWGGLVYVDFLYWYGKDTGLTLGQVIAVSTSTVFNQTLGILEQTETTYFDASWDPGVRVGIGFNSCSDGWDLDLSWTYYKTCRKKSLSAKSGTLYINSWMDPANGFHAIDFNTGNLENFTPLNDSIHGKYRQRLNYIDLELGRKYWLSKCMTFRPFMGIRGAWDNARLAVDGVVTNPSGTTTANPLDETTLKTCSWGVGILAGIEPDWHLGCGFSIYGTFDAALLYGDFEIKRSETVFANETSSEGTPYKDKFSTMLPILDLGLGIKWERSFCDHRYMGALQLGWEHHIWFEHNHRPLYGDIEGVSIGLTPIDGTQGFFVNNNTRMQYGNFAFGGLVVRARFDF